MLQQNIIFSEFILCWFDFKLAVRRSDDNEEKR